MSSPNHLTFGIEDAFSSNFPDFIPASPDYVPASPGKTYSSSSNSFGVVPIASPTLLLFHDDPYMKVMQAFYAEKSPIPPPTIIPQSSMLNSTNSFFLMGYYTKEIRITDLEHIINDIQIRHQKDKERRTSEAPAMTQAAIKKLVDDSVTAALEALAATMAGTSNLNRNTDPTGNSGLGVLTLLYYQYLQRI
ncbi:hypothetical protein Tco_0715670 [Tanacetum coccineum]